MVRAFIAGFIVLLLASGCHEREMVCTQTADGSVTRLSSGVTVVEMGTYTCQER